MNTETIRARLALAIGGEARLASFYTARTMRDLGERARRELDDAAASCTAMLDRVQRALIAAELDDWRQGTAEDLVARYARFWTAWQVAGSQVANWMITGPANFPVARNNKRLATEDRRYAELRAFTQEAPAREVKRARRAKLAAIGAQGNTAIELADVRQRIAARERRQAMMRAANAAIRKGRFTGKEGEGEALAKALAAQGFPLGAATCQAMLEPDWSGRRGFASFQLSNNNAEIARLKLRLVELEAKAQRMAAAEAEGATPAARMIGEVELREDTADDRLRLIFPGKPSDAARALLKGRGFRWSPSNGAWQRQLTNAAREAAEGILRQLAAA